MTPERKMITEPGIYDIPLASYHSQCTDGVSVSSSDLRRIAQTCPAKWWAYASANPRRLIEPSSLAMDFGSAVHAYLLDSGEFSRRFVVSPFDTFRTKDAQAWRAETEASGATILKQDQIDRVVEIARAVMADPYASKAIDAATAERSMIWKDQATGLWLKSRPDLQPEDRTAFIKDLKTTSKSIEPSVYGRNVFALGGHQQAALAVDGWTALTGEDPAGFAHIAVEIDPPYLVGLRVFDADQIAFGRQQNREALDAIARGLETGVWPGYADIAMIETPRWIAAAMTEEQDYGQRNDDGERFSPAEYATAL